MDPGSILVALEEQSRWRERRRRLEDRLRATKVEKLTLRRELEYLRRRLADLERELKGSQGRGAEP